MAIYKNTSVVMGGSQVLSGPDTDKQAIIL